VVSRTLAEPLPWSDSLLLKNDALAAVESLKAEPGKNILIMGRGMLIRSLLGTGAVDEYVLLIHPLVLGSGTRHFPEAGIRLPLAHARSAVTPTGVVVVTYRSAPRAQVTPH
jgi:dihydrofolate reductase